MKYIVIPVVFGIILCCELLHINAQDCTLPSQGIVDQSLKDEVTNAGGEGGSVSIRGGPYYTCQVQGTTMGTYQELSIIMEYTDLGGDKVGQFEMTCSSGNWFRRQESLMILSTGPGVTYDGSIGLRTDCSSCINTAGNDNNCVACHADCNVGLMRCTGSGSDDCCVAFDPDGNCQTTTNCTTPNFIANDKNNFTCACGLSCSDGYTFNSASCTCYLTDICLADNPCDNNGSCTLDTTPDQYTCNCTGTGYTGTNCIDLIVSCNNGFTLDTTSNTCYLTDICLADNPCDNGGDCILDTTPDQYTCNCTGTGYTGTNCTDPLTPGMCTLVCSNGYQPNEACTQCILSDICVVDNPCSNGGSCMLDSPPDQYTCQCVDNYSGTNCTECSLVCLNDGVADRSCRSCDCAPGYTGGNCSACATGYTANRDGTCGKSGDSPRQSSDSFELWWVILLVVLLVAIAIAAIVTIIVIVIIVRRKHNEGTRV